MEKGTSEIGIAFVQIISVVESFTGKLPEHFHEANK